VRDATGLSDTQLRLHLERLVQMEYLLVHRGQRGQSFEYELLYDGSNRDEQAFVPGLIDVEALKANAEAATGTTTTASSRGETGEFAPPTRGQRGPNAGGSRGDQSGQAPAAARVGEESTDSGAETHALRPNGQIMSYPHPPLVAHG
jgi:hypothetical protein